MKNPVNVICTVGLMVCAFSAAAQVQDFEKIPWEKKKIVKGLVWKHTHDSLFGAPQNINILEVNLRQRSVNLIYDASKNAPTSQMASDAGSLAAVNAGFFDMKNGGSITFIKVDGVHETDTSKWKNWSTMNGALIIKKDGTIDLEPAAAYTLYENTEAYDDVLVTGPVLIDRGTAPELPAVEFVDHRHPRTCLCIGRRNTVKFVTVDGRSEQSAGMSLRELTDLMKSLQCEEAINLDGGGSTTLWIKKEVGVVSMPSDNKKFDHEGERSVSNILAVF